MSNTEFTLWHENYRVCFAYDYGHDGQPYQVAAWLEHFNDDTRNPRWERISNHVGLATLRHESLAAQERERTKLHNAINILALRPALRKQAIRAANRLTVPAAFNKETGRKLALARYLKLIDWSRNARIEVWNAYFNRFTRRPSRVFRTQHEIAQAVANIAIQPVREQEQWDSYQAALTAMEAETPDAFAGVEQF